jgi:hypothetical protein
MFSYQLEPSCDEWREYHCPELCKSRIKEICQDILKRGDETYYAGIYEAIYELVQADVESEYFEEMNLI